jgi:hypothetical protein
MVLAAVVAVGPWVALRLGLVQSLSLNALTLLLAVAVSTASLGLSARRQAPIERLAWIGMLALVWPVILWAEWSGGSSRSAGFNFVVFLLILVLVVLYPKRLRPDRTDTSSRPVGDGLE